MNEKQLNENLVISKSLNIHTASLDTFFFFTIRGTLFFLLYFIFKLYRFIFNHSYDLGCVRVRYNSDIPELDLFINLQVCPIHPLLFSCIISTR